VTSTQWWTELKSITLHVEGESPRLWPESASDDHRRARMDLRRAEEALREQIEAVPAQRRAPPAGGELGAYTFTEDRPTSPSTGQNAPSRSPSSSATMTSSSSTT
jgi:hypothetical protein